MLKELLVIFNQNAETVTTVMFSHPAAGPLTALQALELALAHFDSHRRQINRKLREISAGGR